MPMQALRNLLHQHRPLAALLVALALCMKIIVPPGFMPGASGTSLAVTICDGRGMVQVWQIIVPRASHVGETPADSGKTSDVCPYTALGMAGLGGAPAALLVAALAFILARGVRPPVLAQLARRSFLRPPLRAPPALG